MVEQKTKVVGYISRRRCIGKNLAFADIQVMDDNNGSKDQVIQVVFQRDSEAWNQDLDETFPSKNSKLPYGGKVSVELWSYDKNQKEELKEEKGDLSFLVHQWKLLENPREKALEEAQESDTGGISCTKYLKSRGDAFLRFNKNQPTGRQPRETEDKASTPSSHAERMIKPSSNELSEFSHGDNRAKALRAKIFASWLIETYGQDYLQSGIGVLDIAGGKGKLSIELSLQGKIQSTIVDPLVRKHGSKLEPRDAKRIRKAEAPHPNLISKPFNRTSFLQDCEDMLIQSQLCVGLHPDECTEDILDLALQYNKPVAIVPCCVFSGFFPLRTLASGAPVRTYEQFLEYLLAKDERLQKTTLPFEGRNVVIFLGHEA